MLGDIGQRQPVRCQRGELALYQVVVHGRCWETSTPYASCSTRTASARRTGFGPAARAGHRHVPGPVTQQCLGDRGGAQFAGADEQDGDRTGRAPGTGRRGRSRHRHSDGVWESAPDQGPHLGDLALLSSDDLLSERLGLGVLPIGQLGLGHLDRALVMRGHHLQEGAIERGPGGLAQLAHL